MIVSQFVSGVCPWGPRPDNPNAMGWRRVDCAEFYTMSHYPPGLAHDIMDHWDMQSVEDEVMAHASECWMRVGYTFKWPEYCGHPFWWERRGRALVLQKNIEFLASSGLVLKPCKPQHALPPVVEARLKAAIRPFNIPYYKDWFRKGYRRTANRFGKIGKTRSCEIFQELGDMFVETLKDVTPNQRLTIYIDNDTGQWSRTVDSVL